MILNFNIFIEGASHTRGNLLVVEFRINRFGGKSGDNYVNLVFAINGGIFK